MKNQAVPSALEVGGVSAAGIEVTPTFSSVKYCQTINNGCCKLPCPTHAVTFELSESASLDARIASSRQLWPNVLALHPDWMFFSFAAECVMCKHS